MDRPEPTTCTACGAAWEPGFAVCWRCGSGADGAPADASFVPETAGVDDSMPPARAPACVRCGGTMASLGRMRFHEGTRAWPFLLGEFGELLVNRVALDACACRQCGRMEFFLVGPPPA